MIGVLAEWNTWPIIPPGELTGSGRTIKFVLFNEPVFFDFKI